MARNMHPIPLYHLARDLKRRIVGLDWGKKGAGICILDLSVSKPRSFVLPLVQSNKKVNYAIRPLEIAIRDFCRRFSAPAKFQPIRMIPLQVLRPKHMSMFDMSTILKDVAAKHNAVGYAFGYSSDKRQWEKKDLEDLKKMEYFVKFFKDLDKDGGLPLQLFTLYNEKNSTKKADASLSEFHQLSSVYNFLNSFCDFGFSRRLDLENELAKYGIPDAWTLQQELDFLIKSIGDCYAAVAFTEDYADKVADNRLFKKTTFSREMDFLLDLSEKKMGYPCHDDSFLIHGSEGDCDRQMDCFYSCD